MRANDDLDRPLRAGWARAAEAQHDARWAAPFVEVEPTLAVLIDAEAGAAVAVERLRANQVEVAERVPPPWPRAASEQALQLLVELVHRGGDWRRPRLLAERIDPALAAEAAKRLGALDPATSAAHHAEEILTLLTFRHEMYEELR